MSSVYGLIFTSAANQLEAPVGGLSWFCLFYMCTTDSICFFFLPGKQINSYSSLSSKIAFVQTTTHFFKPTLLGSAFHTADPDLDVGAAGLFSHFKSLPLHCHRLSPASHRPLPADGATNKPR